MVSHTKILSRTVELDKEIIKFESSNVEQVTVKLCDACEKHVRRVHARVFGVIAWLCVAASIIVFATNTEDRTVACLPLLIALGFAGMWVFHACLAEDDANLVRQLRDEILRNREQDTVMTLFEYNNLKRV